MRGAVCTNRCEVRLYVDGVETPLPQAAPRTSYSGEVVVLLLDGAPAGVLRKLELVMPWGGVVAFRSFTLSPAGARLARPAPPPLTATFYGDSITQGFCADVPYPEALGQWNNWETINLGIGGMHAVNDAALPRLEPLSPSARHAASDAAVH